MHKVIALLKEFVSKIKNTVTVPAVDVEIIEVNECGPKRAVRPYCHTAHCWLVYFDTNKVIDDNQGAAGFPVATRLGKFYPI